MNTPINHQITKNNLQTHPRRNHRRNQYHRGSWRKLLDVAIDHPVYGELTGALNIFDQADADQFNQKVVSGEASLLSELTEGIHVHTIAASPMMILEAIEEKLKEKGYLACNPLSENTKQREDFNDKQPFIKIFLL